MPQLAALYKRNQDKGFVLVGLHCQEASDEAIGAVAKKTRAKFPITTGGSIPTKSNGIPHTLLFDAEGKCVFEGHPADDAFEKAVRKAMKALATTAEAKPGATTLPDTAAKSLFPERAWTNSEGRSVTAELLSVTDGTGSFRMKNGKSFELKLEKLSEADQKLIAEEVAKREKSAAPPKAAP
jgi:hypothetical protein